MVKFGGITTGKTVDSSGKTVVIPLISIIISVDNSGHTTKGHQILSLISSGILVLVIPPNFTTYFQWYTTDIPMETTGIPLIYLWKPLPFFLSRFLKKIYAFSKFVLPDLSPNCLQNISADGKHPY